MRESFSRMEGRDEPGESSPRALLCSVSVEAIVVSPGVVDMALSSSEWIGGRRSGKQAEEQDQDQRASEHLRSARLQACTYFVSSELPGDLHGVSGRGR